MRIRFSTMSVDSARETDFRETSIFIAEKCAFGYDSIQTLFQIPEVFVYHIP